MSYPADLKSILVRERIIAVLNDIAEGDNYFFSPGVVYDNYKNWKEREAWPAYEVWFGEGEEPTPYAGLQMEEAFTLTIRGSVKSDDPPATVRKCLRDVRKAVMDDAAGGTLSTLTLRVKLGPSRTDQGREAMLGTGWFEQDFQITISGLIESL